MTIIVTPASGRQDTFNSWLPCNRRAQPTEMS